MTVPKPFPFPIDPGLAIFGEIFFSIDELSREIKQSVVTAMAIEMENRLTEQLQDSGKKTLGAQMRRILLRTEETYSLPTLYWFLTMAQDHGYRIEPPPEPTEDAFDGS